MQVNTVAQRPLKSFTIDFRFQDSDIVVSFKGVYSESAEAAMHGARDKLVNPEDWECIGIDRDDR